MALCKPGDTVLGMSLADGGHLTHGSHVSFSGKIYNAVQYGLNPETGEIDYDEVEKLAKEHKPKMIIAGYSAYSQIIDWAIQMHGATGMSQWTPLAGMYADQRHLRFADGPDEVHHMVVGRAEVQKHKLW